MDIFCTKICWFKSVSARHIWEQGGSERRSLADIPIALCRIFCSWVHRYNINNNEVVVSIIPTVWECFWRRSIVGEHAPFGGEFAVVGILDNSAAVLFIGDTYWVDTGILIYIAYGNIMARGTVAQVIAETKLKTFEISGADVPLLRQKFEHNSDIATMALFGENLHICGTNPTKLQKLIEAQKTLAQFQSKEIETSLEDAFIYYLNKAKEN